MLRILDQVKPAESPAMPPFEQPTAAENQQRARDYLQRFKQQPVGHYIAGQWCATEGAELFANINPADNSPMGKVVAGTPEDMDRACTAAAEAFPEWAALPGARRKKLLNRLADLLEARADEIALVESSDCGQPIRFMKQAAVRGAANFRFSPTRHQKPVTACPCCNRSTPITPCVHRSARWALSRPGIPPSCWRPGK